MEVGGGERKEGTGKGEETVEEGGGRGDSGEKKKKRK